MSRPDPARCLAMLAEWERIAVEAIAEKLGAAWEDTPLMQIVETLAVEQMADQLQELHGSWERGQARREAAWLLKAGTDSGRVAERVRKRLDRWMLGQNVRGSEKVA